MQSLLDALQSASGVLALVALVVAFVTLVLVLMRGKRRAPEGLTPWLAGDPILDRLLASQMQRLDGVADELMAQGARIRVMEAASRHAVQRVGLVRYNPFEDTGGNQSFALAMLDANGDGWVMSSLHARTGTRFYTKAVKGGLSDTALSEEEQAAIRQATA